MHPLMEKGANLLWVDFLANGARLAEQGAAKQLVRQAKAAGITHLVADAKIPYGHTAYLSVFAPHVSGWSDGRFRAWKRRDFLREMIREARAAGLKIIANIDVFAEGTAASRDGLAYVKKDWQVVYCKPGPAPSFVNAEHYGEEDCLFVNPIHPEVRAYELSIIKEVASSYDIDGIVLDRCRYPNVYADFSVLSRETFERCIGHTVERWPQDILGDAVRGERHRAPQGKWFPKWAEWRAHNIKRFVLEAKAAVKASRPRSMFGVYVGSWYPVYYNEGVNWGSETYRPNLPWASPDYHRSGYADALDWIMTGCYYPDVTKKETAAKGLNHGYSVEGAIEVSREAVGERIPVLAGLFLKNYEGRPEQFRKAVRLCRERAHGVMLFDAVYLETYGWWEALAAALESG